MEAGSEDHYAAEMEAIVRNLAEKVALNGSGSQGSSGGSAAGPSKRAGGSKGKGKKGKKPATVKQAGGYGLPRLRKLSSVTRNGEWDPQVDPEEDEEWGPDVLYERRLAREIFARHKEEEGRDPYKSVRRERNSTLEADAQVMEHLAKRTRLLPGNLLEAHWFVGMPKQFSSTDLNALEKTQLGELLVNGSHKGRFLLGRTIASPASLGEISFLIEDEVGDVEYMSVSFLPLPGVLPSTTAQRLAELDAIYPVGTVFALREPIYKHSPLGNGPVLLVHAPTDIVFLSQSHPLLVDASWAHPSAGKRVDDLKAAGNAAFMKKQHLVAAKQWSRALEQALDAESQLLLLLNRAEAHISIGNHRSAYRDAARVIKLLHTGAAVGKAASREKALWRRARAEEGMKLYTVAGATFAEVVEAQPDNAEAKAGAARMAQREQEAKTGEYDWGKLYRDSLKPFTSHDVADYVGPIEIREAADKGGGRGVFAKRDIAVGELLLVEKAFVHQYQRLGHHGVRPLAFDFAHELIREEGHAALVAAAIEKVMDDGSLTKVLDSLYAGEDMPSPTPFDPSPRSLEVETQACVDTARIERLCDYNIFGIGRIPLVNDVTDTFMEAGLVEDTEGNGLFVRCSFMNHSCLPNSRRQDLGDVMVIRARTLIPKDEEVTIAYTWHPDLDTRRADLREAYGFGTCSCELCVMDELDGVDKRAEREALCGREQDYLRQVVQDASQDQRHVFTEEAAGHHADVLATYDSSRGDFRPGAQMSASVLAEALYSAPGLKQSGMEEVVEMELASLRAGGAKVSLLPPSADRALDIEAVTVLEAAPDEIVVSLALSQRWLLLKKPDQARRWMRTAIHFSQLNLAPGAAVLNARFGVRVKNLGLQGVLKDVLEYSS